MSDFIEGIYRIELFLGIYYEFYFRNFNIKELGRYFKVVIFKFFGLFIFVINTIVRIKEIWINIILLLKGRLDFFEVFMRNFVDVCIMIDKCIYLSIVYFG